MKKLYTYITITTLLLLSSTLLANERNINKVCAFGAITNSTLDRCKHALKIGTRYTLSEKQAIFSSLLRYYRNAPQETLIASRLCIENPSIVGNLKAYSFPENLNINLFVVCIDKVANSAINYYYGIKNYPQSYKKSYFWINQTNPKKDKSGFFQFALGYMYQGGLGVQKNLDKALYWYKESNHSDFSADTTTNIGIIYYDKNDFIQSFEYLNQAAKLGSPLAMLRLAQMYLSGEGAIQNIQKAYAWASVSRAIGFKNKNKLASLSLQTSKEVSATAATMMAYQDKTGSNLAKAKQLALVYYDQYLKLKNIKPAT